MAVVNSDPVNPVNQRLFVCIEDREKQLCIFSLFNVFPCSLPATGSSMAVVNSDPVNPVNQRLFVCIEDRGKVTYLICL